MSERAIFEAEKPVKFEKHELPMLTLPGRHEPKIRK